MNWRGLPLARIGSSRAEWGGGGGRTYANTCVRTDGGIVHLRGKCVHKNCDFSIILHIWLLITRCA